MTWTPRSIIGAPYHRSAEAMAVSVASAGPCAKSKRGAVIVTSNRWNVYRAFNGPPAGVSCTADDTCKSTCRIKAMHAEQRALFAAGRHARGAEMVHAKVVDGKLVPSGPPSCGQCSKAAFDAGIAGFWLYHQFEGGPRWHRWDMDLFHARSLASENERAAEAQAKADERIRAAVDLALYPRDTEREYLRHKAGCRDGESLHDAIVRLRAVQP